MNIPKSVIRIDGDKTDLSNSQILSESSSDNDYGNSASNTNIVKNTNMNIRNSSIWHIYIIYWIYFSVFVPSNLSFIIDDLDMIFNSYKTFE